MRPVLLLCLAGLVAGCGADASTGPVALPPVTGTVAPSTSAPPTAAPVPKPADADALTSEGAASFVRYYFATLNAALASNDTKELAGLTAPECEGCQRYITSIQQVAAAKQHVRTDGIVVTTAVAPGLMDDETTVLVDFDAAPFTTFDASNTVVSEDPGAKGLTGEVRCVRRGAGWIAMGFRLVAH